MGFKYREYPDWSWSQTRDRIFKECQRKYYYHYYASHNGWLPEASKLSKSAYRLKQIANLYIIFGDALHQLMERLLNDSLKTDVISVDAKILQKKLKNYLNRAFIDSRNVSQWMQAPKRSMMLHEMYYEGVLNQNRIDKINERIVQCVSNLRHCLSLRELMHNKVNIIEIEQLNSFLIVETPVFVKMDVLYFKPGDDRWIIVDWKTGLDDEENEDQLLLYAMYLNNKYQVPYEKTEIRLEYLLTGECKVIHVKKDEVKRTIERVNSSAAQMKLLLEDELTNKPMPEGNFTASPSKMKCKGCNFREMCEDKFIE
ncbi:PD-(D/E)XK nuclease family protein [Paenibacillus terreus]|uniref:PD-(D/E)XK nuclease family protein n=1 Tax=Paenibacillus terreus TaxID=1387834 RepID=A0ABV5B8T3_9BACL